MTKFQKQIRHFGANITLTIKSTSEIAGKQTGTSPLNSKDCLYAT